MIKLLIIQIPWKERFFQEFHFFCFIISFVPKIFYVVDDNNKQWDEKNPDAKFRFIIKGGK